MIPGEPRNVDPGAADHDRVFDTVSGGQCIISTIFEWQYSTVSPCPILGHEHLWRNYRQALSQRFTVNRNGHDAPARSKSDAGQERYNGLGQPACVEGNLVIGFDPKIMQHTGHKGYFSFKFTIGHGLAITWVTFPMDSAARCVSRYCGSVRRRCIGSYR